MKKEKKAGDNKVTYGTVSLPTPLIDIIKKKIHGTGMQSVSAYVSFVLRQVLAEETLDDKTQQEVKRRLKALGYV